MIPIEVKYIGPTNKRGSRWKITWGDDTKYYSLNGSKDMLPDQTESVRSFLSEYYRKSKIGSIGYFVYHGTISSKIHIWTFLNVMDWTPTDQYGRWIFTGDLMEKEEWK